MLTAWVTSSRDPRPRLRTKVSVFKYHPKGNYTGSNMDIQQRLPVSAFLNERD